MHKIYSKYIPTVSYCKRSTGLVNSSHPAPRLPRGRRLLSRCSHLLGRWTGMSIGVIHRVWEQKPGLNTSGNTFRRT